MTGKNTTLYIKAEQVVEVTEPKVTLSDVLKMECIDQGILNRLNSLVIVKFKEMEYKRTVISILKIIQLIHENYPELQIENLGDLDIIVKYENQKVPSWIWHRMKATLVIVISFLGSAYSIMAFSNDVDTLEIFNQLYYLIVGKQAQGYTVLEASYCVGLVVGILVFFNHFGNKKLTVDPTPMEIEMRLYEQDIQTTLIQNYSRKGAEIDVDNSIDFDCNRD
ncbi:MAG: stage V sporulation protein AA [Eubacteriales bacterium]